MSRGKYQSTPFGIPALVFVPSGKTIVIIGKVYQLLKMYYDIKEEYISYATMRP